jgi:hypothetical protein
MDCGVPVQLDTVLLVLQSSPSFEHIWLKICVDLKGSFLNPPKCLDPLLELDPVEFPHWCSDVKDFLNSYICNSGPGWALKYGWIFNSKVYLFLFLFSPLLIPLFL